MLATQMPDTPPEAKDVKQVKLRASPCVQRPCYLEDLLVVVFSFTVIPLMRCVRLALLATVCFFFFFAKHCLVVSFK